MVAFILSLVILALVLVILFRKRKLARKIDRQNALLEAVSQVSTILLEQDLNQFEASLVKSMGILGMAVNVHRVRLWKNYMKGRRLYCNLVNEWVEDASENLSGRHEPGISYEDSLPGWQETLS